VLRDEKEGVGGTLLDYDLQDPLDELEDAVCLQIVLRVLGGDSARLDLGLDWRGGRLRVQGLHLELAGHGGVLVQFEPVLLGLALVRLQHHVATADALQDVNFQSVFLHLWEAERLARRDHDLPPRDAGAHGEQRLIRHAGTRN